MYTYLIDQTLTLLERPPRPEEDVLFLLTSQELTQSPAPPGLETTFHHTPSARDARVCKAEVRRDCLGGTVVTPRRTKEGRKIAFGYLLTQHRVVLCDDAGTAHSLVRRLARDKRWRENGVGHFFYDFLELLIARDLHHLEELEDQAARLEDDVLSGSLDGFNAAMTNLRKQTMDWMRYYSQLDDVACELQENENGFFTDGEQHLFHMLERRIDRLRNEAQLLREYGMQVRELFQGEIGIRQNRIMKILTVVTTLCLPLSLVAGWYGMNFAGMPELTWKYGYPAVIGASAVIMAVCLWICKRKRFW